MFSCNKKFLKRFLRGLFDTDGSLYFERNRPSSSYIHNRPNICLGITSKNIAEQVFNLLFELDYHPRWKKPFKGKRDKNFVYSVLIYRKKEVERWIKEIKFKNFKHKTKWLLFKKYGYCPPKTTLLEREKLLNKNI